MKTPPVVLALALAAAPAVGQYVCDSVYVYGNFVGSLAYNSRADVVYGATNTGDRFFAIACSSNTVISSLGLPYPGRVVYNSVENKAYASYGTMWDSVIVVSGVTHQPTKRLYLPGANVPVWDSIGSRIYVSCGDYGYVGVIDCATDSVIGTIPVGAWPLKLHVNPLRRKLYVQNYDENTVSIVDMTTNQVIKTVYVGRYMESGWYDPECDKYYCGKTSEAVVFSGVTDTILYRIPVGGSVEAIGGGCQAWSRLASTKRGAWQLRAGTRAWSRPLLW